MLKTLHSSEMLLLLLALYLLSDELESVIAKFESLLTCHIKEQRRLVRALPEEKKRIPWSFFCDKVSDCHFRRMFRMEPDVFKRLCQTVCASITESIFKPEEHLMKKLGSDGVLKRISGEVKMAVCLRMMAGGSYLDLVPLFDVSSGHLYKIFDTFLDWILLTFEFPLVQWLRGQNWSAFEALASSFAEKSNGVFYGPFGALDGLAVRIRSPTLREVAGLGNYYCRKGFYALNVQAICDRFMRFLYCFPSNKGSTHDSQAFGNSRLNDLLHEMAEELFKRGLFIAGDSAYNLLPFLIIPWESASISGQSGKARDAFNFYLSSCRIHIECAFGELIMRWGIFWRKLQFTVKKSCKIIQVAMLLQNFIIENRENGVLDDAYFSNFKVDSSDPMQLAVTAETGEQPRALVTDNNEPRPPGRPTIADVELHRKGAKVRDRLTTTLAVHNMNRPLHNNMRYNKEGHIFMTY